LASLDLSPKRHTDPFYIYHQHVIIAVLSLKAGCSYSIFVAAIVASLPMALALRHALDQLINRLRDRIRGRGLRKRDAPVVLGDVALAAATA
jgi:peptidoglycan/LPS O-acetylase OafA/YrhL